MFSWKTIALCDQKNHDVLFMIRNSFTYWEIHRKISAEREFLSISKANITKKVQS